MKRQEIESIINPRSYNKHYYTEDGWQYLEEITTALETMMRLCKANGLTRELDKLITITEDDFIYRLQEIYQHIKENEDGENIL